jgi:PKD repeat protein
MFDGTASQNAASFTWDFGDGSGGRGVTAAHTFTRRGTFEVTLWTQPAGAQAVASKSIACSKKACS